MPSRFEGKSALLIGLVSLLAIASAAVLYVLFVPTYVALSGVDPADKQKVIEQLKAENVPYKVDGQGNIMVPESVHQETEISLGSRSLSFPSRAGLELFEQSDYGMTEFAQKINFQRAVQDELSRTISALEGIKDARVHIVFGERKLFQKSQSNDQKASVTLLFKQGQTAKPGQITGIQQMVASAVPGLAPETVVVLDENGKVLSKKRRANGEEATVDARLQSKREYENYLSAKVQSTLDRIFGEGNAFVQADVTFDFTKQKTLVENLIPARTGRNASGLVATKREVVNAQSEAGSAKATGNSSKSTTTEIEYQFGKSKEERYQPPGLIKQVNVGVVVTNSKLSEQEQSALIRMIKQTAGINESRGDQLEVFWNVSAKAEVVDEKPVETSPVVQLPTQQSQVSLPVPNPNHLVVNIRQIGLLVLLVLLVGLLLVGVVIIQGQKRQRRIEAQLEQWLAEAEHEAS